MENDGAAASETDEDTDKSTVAVVENDGAAANEITDDAANAAVAETENAGAAAKFTVAMVNQR